MAKTIGISSCVLLVSFMFVLGLSIILSPRNEKIVAIGICW